MAPPRQSAGGIVLNPEGKIILVNQGSNVWSFPKGGLEEGESELEAARREVREETGITELTLMQELGSYERYSIGKGGIGEQTELGLRKRTLFLFTTTEVSAGFRDPDGEILSTRWVTIDEALGLLTHPKDKEFLESVRSTVEYYMRA